MLFEDQLAALEADSQAGRHAGRGARLRAAGRRPRGRARAGHHDRRRLPLLLHREAQVHRRRHARPRAVHAQHGHRRLDRRSGRDPDRCAQGRADADAAPQLPRVAARHPARRAGGQQDGPGRLLAETCSRAIEADYREFAAEIGLADVTCIPISALKGDNIVDPRGRDALVPGADADGHSRSGRDRRDAGCRSSRSACRCSGSTGPTWISAASPARSSRGAVRPGDAVRVQPSGRESAVSRIVTADGDLDEAVAGQSITLTLDRRDRHLARRRDRRGRRARRGGRPVRGDGRLDERISRCCAAATT